MEVKIIAVHSKLRHQCSLWMSLELEPKRSVRKFHNVREELQLLLHRLWEAANIPSWQIQQEV